MTPARNAISLSESPTAVNNPVETSPTRARAEARMRVVYDANLSDGARVLYIALDDYAGMKAIAWPHQSTLAERLQVSIREVQRRLDELAAGGYIESERTQCGCLYRLLWLVSGTAVAPRRGMSVASSPSRHDTAVASPPSQCDRAATSDATNQPCGKVPKTEITVESSIASTQCAEPEPKNEPVKEEEPRSIDRPADPDRNTKMTWMAERLAEYPGALARIGHRPDSVIARDCLETAGWDTAAICQALRETYLRGGRRAMPSESWAWFRSVLRNYFALVPAAVS
jgi:hypothetical protein